MNIYKSILLLMIAGLVIALSPVAAVAAPARSTCTTHVVQPGENLFRISLRYNVTIAAIMQANGLFNPNYVYVGQVLCIPTTPIPPSLPSPQFAPPPPSAAGTRYQVQPGDTLSAIAVRSGTTIYAIMQANGLTNANYIYVGQWLLVPGRPAVSTTTTAPSAPPAGKWKGEYYDNSHLAGSPKLVRYETVVEFDWGFDPPSSRIPADDFSARWSRTVYLNAGKYRFTVTVDDGVRLWVDDQPLIDKWGEKQSATHTADIDLDKGYHSVRMEYQELSDSAMAMLAWIRVSGADVTTAAAADVTTAAAAGELQPTGAWQGEYFNHHNLNEKPDAQRLDPAIDFDWSGKSPFQGEIEEDFFAVRWTRNVHFEGGTYRFHVRVDDSVRLYIDNEVVLDRRRESDKMAFSKEAEVSAGVHEVKVEYYEQAYEALISVWWEKLE